MSYTRVQKDKKVNEKDSNLFSIPIPLKKYKPFYTIDENPNNDDGYDDTDINSGKDNKVLEAIKTVWLVLTKPYWNLFIVISLIVLTY